MSEEQIEAAVEAGRRNQQAEALLANHCAHARLELPSGRSLLGGMLGLPIGMARVRCPHAGRPSGMSMHGLDLAVEFYESNCVGCLQRAPNGLLPTIATEAEKRRRAAEAARNKAAAEEASEREAWERRRSARRVAVASEGYPARDLAADLDLLDPPPGVSEAENLAATAQARRRVEETARRAPNLFTPRLSAALIELARHRCDPTCCTALRWLARSGQVPRSTAASVAAEILGIAPTPEAGRLVAELAPELRREEIARALPGAITLAGDDDDGFLSWRPPADPAALLALAEVDLVLTTDAIIKSLASPSDQVRADATEAARYLLMVNPHLIVGLGGPLVASIRGADEGYAGTPSPGASAARALAEAWRGAPVATCHAVESGAAALNDPGREVLGRVIPFLHRWRDDTPVPDEAVHVAVAFLLRRVRGDWAGRVADEATDELLDLARRYPRLLLPSADALLGALLAACEPPAEGPLDVPNPLPGDVGTELRAMELMGERMSRNARRRDLAQALGLLARIEPSSIVPKVAALLAATSGDAELDSVTRSSLVTLLAASVTSETISTVLPTLYTCLLREDVAVRAAAIELWEACARCAAELPHELAELAPTLLRDPYVAVHTAMLRRFSSLGLPPEISAALVETFAALALTYESKDADLLDRSLRGVLWAADKLDDPDVRTRWHVWVLSRLQGLAPYDREGLLLDTRLAAFRRTPPWAAIVLKLLADPARVDRFNRRQDRLLAALISEPDGLRRLPVKMFRDIADIHLPEFVAAAVEPVGLLQVASRWHEAAQLASDIADAIPATREHAKRRWFGRAVAAAAEGEFATADNRASPPLPPAIGEAEGAPEPEFFAVARARASLRGALSVLPVVDPVRAAQVCEGAANTLSAAPGDEFARWHADAVRVAVRLLRYDAAIRRADPSAASELAAANRSARVLQATIGESSYPQHALARFAAMAADASVDLDSALALLRSVPLALPLCEEALLRGGAAGGQPTPAPQQAEAEQKRDASASAVCVLSVDDDPVVDVIVLRDGWAYDLTVDVRLEAWPDWADTCHVALLTTLPPDALTLPQLHFVRADAVESEYGLTVTGTGTLRTTVGRRSGRPPLDLPVHVRFTSADGRAETVNAGGFRRLRLRPYDPSRDAMTDHRQVDQRLLELFDPLHDDQTLDPDDVAAFCRLFAACVRAAQRIMFDVAFRSGQKVTEQQFHDKLEEHLRLDPILEGRLSRRDRVAGGFDDLLHDDVIAELKVEKRTPRTVDECARYVGQPTQYGVGRGSRLSILVVLDQTKKSAPPAVLENHVGWLLPAHHGLSDARYPSRVGVLIINANWPVPSSWSRRTIAVASDKKNA